MLAGKGPSLGGIPVTPGGLSGGLEKKIRPHPETTFLKKILSSPDNCEPAAGWSAGVLRGVTLRHPEDGVLQPFEGAL